MLPTINASDAARSSLEFLPELLLCFAIVFLLFMRAVRLVGRAHLGSAALMLTLGALLFSALQWVGSQYDPRATSDPSLLQAVASFVYRDIGISGPSRGQPHMLFGDD